MMSIYIKFFKNFSRKKKMFPKRVYRCPHLITFVDEMGNFMINDVDGILIFVKEIDKN